jgi:hypothetical protein
MLLFNAKWSNFLTLYTRTISFFRFFIMLAHRNNFKQLSTGRHVAPLWRIIWTNDILVDITVKPAFAVVRSLHVLSDDSGYCVINRMINKKTTVHRKTCCSTLTHYPDSEPTSLCSYSLILCAQQRWWFGIWCLTPLSTIFHLCRGEA